MKPITKKLLESGIVSQEFAMMFEKWGSLEPGEVGQLKQHRDSLNELVEELDKLLVPEEDIKETRFEIFIKGPPVNLYSSLNGTFSAVEDELGRFIVGPNIIAHSGDIVWKGRNRFLVLDALALHDGPKVVAQQLTLEPDDDY